MITDALLPGSLAKKLEGLHRWQPSRPIMGDVAALLLASQPMSRVQAPWSSEGREALRGQTKAVFDDFIENGRPPQGLFKDTFGRTGIAQMEVLAPNPGVRLFGAFVHTSCFVGIRLLHRDELPFKPTGQRGMVNYKSLGEELVHEWVSLLPTVPRIRIRDL